MKFKHICLAGVAIAALGVGTIGAQARSTAEEDAITRQLNLDQLNDANGAPAQQQTQPSRNGQGGPEFQRPPKPDEGMTDEDTKGDDGKTNTDDENGPPPPEDNTPSKEPMPAPEPQ